MSKEVGELFIYLCIPECTYRLHMWMTLETAVAVA
jgi:hypothetical protein